MELSKNIRIFKLEIGSKNGVVDLRDIPYREVPNECEWKIKIVSEILKIKEKYLQLDNVPYDHLDDILQDVCCT